VGKVRSFLNVKADGARVASVLERVKWNKKERAKEKHGA
jgi:hypothetical protein